MIKGIGIILALMFSVITTFSFISSKKCSKRVKCLEIIGQSAIVLSVIINLLHYKMAFILMMSTGLMLIMIACILNGLKLYGHVHMSHHIVRLILCVVIVGLCVLGA